MGSKMKALILDGRIKENGLPQAVQETASNCLKIMGYDVETLILHEMKIAPCKGCFECWIKTPGICSIDDDGRHIAEAAIKSDLLALITPVTFGGYSSELKKARDRMIPLISPHFMKIGGETHHRPRYDKFPDLAGIGILPAKDADSESIFKTLVRRNAIQHVGAKYSAVVVTGEQDADEIGTEINMMFLNMEEPAV